MARTPHEHTTADELALLIDAVGDYAIFLLSPEGVIRSWNKGASRIFGYDANEVIGQHFSIFYAADDKARDKPGRELTIARDTGRVEDEGWRIRKTGERFWVSTIITALRGPDGELRGFGKVTRDLTTRREAEEQLRRSEEMFRLIVASVRDYAIFMLDPTGHIASWNAGARRIKGWEADEIIGRHFSTFYPPEDVANGKPQRKLEIATEQGSVEDEGWRVRKDGSRFWANVVITAIRDEKGELRGFAKVTRDVTERRQREEMQQALIEQREARLQAEEERHRAETSFRVSQEANRAKDEFLMTLSHELRTPMTAILGWVRLLPTMSPEDPAFREAISSIARGAQLQAHLIDDVLDVSRIVSGKLRLGRENVDVAQLLTSSLEAVRPTADAKAITIATAFSPNLGHIIADPTRVQQVLWNLLSNAVKFTPKHGVVTVGAKRTGSHLQITVSDNGEGIETTFLPHVFEPFRQAENPSTRVHGGLGLGLSIVRYIVEAHGGEVTAQSGGRGKGSTFTVTLPVGVAVPAAIDPQAEETATTTTPRALDPRRLAGLQVAVVDDDPEGRAMLRAVISAAGAAAATFESAAEALSQLSAAPPDLVISDIAMPDMDGYTFARELRRRPEYKHAKVVALTAFPTAGLAAAQSGFDEFLAKPVDPYDLIEAIYRLVHDRERNKKQL